jgi:hypothetical protein
MRLRSRSGLAVWATAGVILAAAGYETHFLRLHLGNAALLSGWVLFGLMVFLAIFNARKRLSMIPLGRASTWLVLHAVGGVLAVGLYFIHADTLWPTGSYERVLAVLFYLVSLSGLFGLTAQLIYPTRLTQIDYEIIYERIPGELARLRGQAEDIVLACTGKTAMDTLAQHYLDTIAWYFHRPRFVLSSLVGSRRAEHWLDREIGSVARYLNDEEKTYLAQLRQLCVTKAKIDSHYAAQSLMKFWLLVHLPLAASVMVVAVWHLLLVHIYAI